MFKTLYSKLVVALLVIVFILAGIGFFSIRYSSEMYQHEAKQKLNKTLAKNIVSEQNLFKNKTVNNDVLKELFHMLMVINPYIEIYLLDTQGKILSYYAHDKKIKRDKINLAPVKKFINNQAVYPIMADDPRHLERKKVFSAARIPEQGKLEGYLYIVLAGENYQSIIEQIKDSHILSNSVISLVVMFVFVLIAGLALFALLTRRLQKLTNIIKNYAGLSSHDTNVIAEQEMRYPARSYKGDEVEQLGIQFNHMADKLDEQIEKLKSNDNQRRELIANVSHDLRTPLATLQSYLETLSMKNSTNEEERRKFLEVAFAQSKRLSTLIDELFELAKLDSCESIVYAEPFSLGELMYDVGQKFQLRAEEKNIKLNIHCSDTSTWVHADIGMMQRVLENLIENALRHTEEGGQISIGFTAKGDQVIIKVADNGHGIPEDELKHIFDRFYRVDKSRTNNHLQDNSADNVVDFGNLPGQSSGLGLAITKRIIELHGSKIKVQSVVNKGTVFSFPMQVFAA